MLLGRVVLHCHILHADRILSMNVILLGYRASGKTSIGKKLAAQLWKDFVDTDQQVRKRFNDQAIAEIWQEHGEPAFRQAEAAVIAELLQKDEQVIATGGGILTHEAGRAAIESAEKVRRIYLSCAPEVLAQRLGSDLATASQRPALTPGSDPVAEVAGVLAKRDPVYRAVADVVFDVSHCSIDEAVHYLIAKL